MRGNPSVVRGGGSTSNRSLWETVFIWTAQATCPVEASAKMDACAFLASCAKAVAWLQQSKATLYPRIGS